MCKSKKLPVLIILAQIFLTGCIQEKSPNMNISIISDTHVKVENQLVALEMLQSHIQKLKPNKESLVSIEVEKSVKMETVNQVSKILQTFDLVQQRWASAKK